MRITPSLGSTECWGLLGVPYAAARYSEQFINVTMAFLKTFAFDGFNLDMESKHVYGPDKSGINAAVNALASRLHGVNATLTRYAGCVHNGKPAYWNETCEEQVSAAPLVDRVAAAGPSWDNTPSGFKGLVLDAINSIGSLYKEKLSIAFCPHGCASPVNLTQKDLYERFDMMCDLDIYDVYLFNLESLQDGDASLSSYYVTALRYFRTGIKVSGSSGATFAASTIKPRAPISLGSGKSSCGKTSPMKSSLKQQNCCRGRWGDIPGERQVIISIGKRALRVIRNLRIERRHPRRGRRMRQRALSKIAFLL